MKLPAPLNPDFERDIRASFDRQGMMRLIGASFVEIRPGHIEIQVPFDEKLTQHHGYIHGAVVASLADTACGFAAMTLSAPETEILTVEYKLNFLAPADGEKLIARGAVRKRGRTLTICAGEVFAMREGKEHSIALILATMMAVPR